jgi:predicted SnoaL-like aldol condensation-catalyzing enzyme
MLTYLPTGKENPMADATDPRALAHRMHDAFNTREIDALDEILAPDFYSHPLPGGRETAKSAWAAMIAQSPAARSVIEDVLADGDRVAVRSTIHGLSGAGPDAPAATLMEIFRVAEGRIAELWAATTISRIPR